MKKALFFSILLGCLLATGCAHRQTELLYQTSTIDALLAGVYDGDLTCQRLLDHGNFGLGTFDHLDGEMIVLDGALYQIKADGKVYEPDSSITTPFATVCAFSPETTFPITAPADFAAVEKAINEQAPNLNLFYAIKIRGNFKTMRTRSVPRQNKPYPPLAEVAKHQPEFPMTNVTGTIVGFRCPAYVKGINVPGYHLHFLSQDHRQGGHILSFEMTDGTCEIDQIHNYFLRLPADTAAFADTDLSQDRSGELKKVESGK